MPSLKKCGCRQFACLTHRRSRPRSRVPFWDQQMWYEAALGWRKKWQQAEKRLERAESRRRSLIVKLTHALKASASLVQVADLERQQRGAMTEIMLAKKDVEKKRTAFAECMSSALGEVESSL